MKSIKNIDSSTYNIKKSPLSSEEKLISVKIYQGPPEALKSHQIQFEKILDKWEKRTEGKYRYDIVIEKDKLYISIIQTKLGKEKEIEKQKKKSELKS